MERKATPLGKTYWNKEGAYQKDYDKLYKKLVPDSGEANTVHGELIRGMSRLYYDYFNNGNGNAVDAVECDCPECHGTGYEDNDDADDCPYCDGDCQIITGYEFENYYKELFDFIKHNLPRTERPTVDNFEKEVLSKNQDHIDEQVYEELTDSIMHFVLTTENKKR